MINTAIGRINIADDFDSIIEKLQNRIFEEAKEALENWVFQRWRNPIYRGRMDNLDAHARIKGTCDDTWKKKTKGS
jgi:nitrogen fixation NifU-like protein